MLQEELRNSGQYVEPTGEELAQIASAAANESSFGCESDSLGQSLLKSASPAGVPEVGDVKSSMGGADGGNGDVRQELLSSAEEEYATPEGASANSDAISSKNSKNSSAERPTAAAPAAQTKGTATKSKKKRKRRTKKKGRPSQPSKSSSTGIPFCSCISTEFLNLLD